MGWAWFALVDEAQASDAAARAVATDEDGATAGVLAVWPADARPGLRAVKIDERVVDPAGERASVSLVLVPRGIRIPFDDPAVQQARRDVLAGPPARAISSLLRGDSIFAGAVTVGGVGDDPFARIFPARLLRVEAGLFGAVDAPAGPDIERHGSGAPWPHPTFG